MLTVGTAAGWAVAAGAGEGGGVGTDTCGAALACGSEALSAQAVIMVIESTKARTNARVVNTFFIDFFLHNPTIVDACADHSTGNVTQLSHSPHAWDRYFPETRDLRLIADDDEARSYKGQHFDYVTPSGVFTYCSDTSLVKHSGVLCMDLDHLDGRVEELFRLLVHEPMFDTLLLFRSPRGTGLKWFIHIDLSRCDHRTWFTAVRNYLMHTYHLTDKQVDKMCGNPSRACFLCHDAGAYLKPDLYEYF